MCVLFLFEQKERTNCVFTCERCRQINLLILSIFHRENGEISILCVRTPSIAFAFQQILSVVLRTPIKTNEEVFFFYRERERCNHSLFVIQSSFYTLLFSPLSLDERLRQTKVTLYSI